MHHIVPVVSADILYPRAEVSAALAADNNGIRLLS
jgi:hypothetical protein